MNEEGLEAVGAELRAIHARLPPTVLESVSSPTTAGAAADAPNVLVVPTDVSRVEDVVRLRDRVYETWGEVGRASACAPRR